MTSDPSQNPDSDASEPAEESESNSEVIDPGNPKDGQESTPSVSDATESLISNMPSLARITSVVMLVVGILIVGLLFYKVMVGFFIPLFMAAALVVIFRPVDEWLLKKLRGR